jgi:hypothetical protein
MCRDLWTRRGRDLAASPQVKPRKQRGLDKALQAAGERLDPVRHLASESFRTSAPIVSCSAPGLPPDNRLRWRLPQL